MDLRLQTSSADETALIGRALAKHLVPGDTVYLIGELGSGKSVLARGIARALGVAGAMPSPTFTLMQPYEGTIPVCHFDLFRLADIDDFFAAGLNEYIGGDGVALIEWPLNGLGALPRVQIRFERGGEDDERQLYLRFFGMESREDDISASIQGWEIDNEDTGDRYHGFGGVGSRDG